LLPRFAKPFGGGVLGFLGAQAWDLISSARRSFRAFFEKTKRGQNSNGSGA
ncbi:MAG: hypothetical protein ACI9KE_006124, partial [Polyangiales bacterium]